MGANPLASLPPGFELDSSSPTQLPPGFELDPAPSPKLQQNGAVSAQNPSGLPLPHEAVAQADQHAQSFVDSLEAFGNKILDTIAPPPSPEQQREMGELLKKPPQLEPSAFSEAVSGVKKGVRDVLHPGDKGYNGPPPGAAVPGGLALPAPVALSDRGAKGLHEVASGILTEGTAALGPTGLIRAPLETLLGLGTGIGAQEATSAGLQKLGVSKPKAELAGDVTGLIAGGAAGHAAGKLREAVSPGGRFRPLNPEVVSEEPPTPPSGYLLDAPEGPIVDTTAKGAGRRPQAHKEKGGGVGPYRREGSGEVPINLEQVPAGAPPRPKAAEKAQVPETGTPEAKARALAARNDLAFQLTGKTFGELNNPDRLAIDELIQQGYQGNPIHRPAPGMPEAEAQPEQSYAEFLKEFHRTGGQNAKTRAEASRQNEKPAEERRAAGGAEQGGGETESPQAPVISFETAKGSRYTVRGDGTERFKAATGEHLPPSDTTVYVAPDVNRRLLEALQAFGADSRIRASIRTLGDGRIGLLVKDRATGQVRNDLSRNIPYSAKPEVGLHPLEIWNKNPDTGEYGFHLGHPIARVERAAVRGSATPDIRQARQPQTAPAYGSSADIHVPGEQTVYPARYAVRELADVEPSHNPFNFEPNPRYAFENDRDYSNPQNAARVAEYATNGSYRPEFALTPSPTAEQGPPIIDRSGNALGGNNRTMTLARVYESNPQGAAAYRKQLAANAAQYGIEPKALGRFRKPVLVRELQQPVSNGTAQRAITDFNKSAAAKLAPEEQAVADGRRMSPRTVQELSANLADVGEDSTLAQALQGDRGQEIVSSLMKDGAITPQEANGYLDERGFLTPEAKQRIAKALVGRLFPSAADYAETPPSIRAKLERVAPQVLRVEDRPEWSLTEPVREAVGALADAKAHGIQNLDDLARQSDLNGNARRYSPAAIAIAKKLQDGPLIAQRAFRQYAVDAEMSRDGSQSSFFEPPTQKEAFQDAFTQRQESPSAAEAPATSAGSRRILGSARELLLGADAEALPKSGAQLVHTLRVNTHAAELLRKAYKLGGGSGDLVSFEGAAAEPHHVRSMLDGLQAMAANQKLGRRARAAAGRMAHELRKASLGGTRGVAIAEPQAESHEHLHFAIDQLQFDPDAVLQHAETLLAVTRARLRGLARGSDARAIREVMTRIANYEHATVGLDDDAAERVMSHFLANSVQDEVGIATLKELAHDRFKDTIGRGRRKGATSDAGTTAGGGEEPEPPADYRARSGRPGGASRVAHGSGRKADEGPETARKRIGLAANDGLFTSEESEQVARESARDRDLLEGQRLTAQFRSPITREEQLKQLRRSKEEPQQDLFGASDEPAQTSLFGPERGGTNLDFLTGGLAGKLQNKLQTEGAVRANYSGLGAMQDKFARNLSQLGKASEEGWKAAVRAASSRSQASSILRTAMPQIERALGNVKSVDFRRALIESRLRGIRERWQKMAYFATRASDENLEKSLPNLLGPLENLEDKKGFGRDLAQTATALAERKQFDLLRELVAKNFRLAADSVAHVMPAAEFDGVRFSPGFRDALKVYKHLVEKPMAESHAQNEGIFSNALGPLDTYYPLVPVEKADRVRAALAERTRYAKPKNLANHFATGLAEEYDADMEALRKNLNRAVRTNNQAALMDALEQQGLVRPLEPFERAGEAIAYAGQEFHAVKRETGSPRQIVRNGKTEFVPPKAYLVPKWLDDELAPILERGERVTPGKMRRLIDLANTVALAGPMDFVFHSANLFGTLVANTPFLGDSAFGKAMSVPLLKRFSAIGKVLATDPTTEEAASELQEMARLGMLPDRFGSETYSKRYAEQTGAELKGRSLKGLSMGPMLYGPKGIDVRARLVMYRLAKQMDPDASGRDLHLFVNQLGTYVHDLQSAVVRKSKGSGLAPFSEAGTRMIQNGVNAWLGTSPMPKSGASLRVWQQLTGGGIATVALWMVAQKAITGKWPWEDKRSKLFEIPVPDEWRRSKLGEMLWGKDAKTGYIRFVFFNPLAGRGARALGVQDAVSTAMQGGDAAQAFDAGLKDIANTAAHPFLGPVPRGIWVGITGTEPYVTGIEDEKGQLEPDFYPLVRTRGLKSIPARAGAAVAELNAFYGDVAKATGGWEHNPHDTTNHWMRMTFDLALPGLVGYAQNPFRQRRRIAIQRRAAERYEERQASGQ